MYKIKKIMGDIVDFTKLKKCLDNMLTEYHTPGVDCMVYKDHQIVYRYYTGLRDLESNIPMDGNELYHIYSMTKMLTCVSALQLLEQGKYTLDDHLSTYMPEFSEMKISPEDFDADSAARIAAGTTVGEKAAVRHSGYAQNPIRIVDLFTMGAGLDYALKAPGIVKALESGKTSTRDLVGAMSETVLGFEPGTRFRYSLCYDVLGALVEIWSGETLGDYMQKHIFAPLGMQETFFDLPENPEQLLRMAARYKYNPQGYPERMALGCAYNLSADYQSGGAGLTSSTADYALFLDAMACGGVGKSGARILKPETVAMMKTNHLSGRAAEDFNKMRPGYGYGLGVRTHLHPEISGQPSPVGEFGWDGAAGAFAMVDTDNKLSLTYFQHVSGWDKVIQSDLREALYAGL